MAKKKRIKELERRVVSLEAEIATLRGRTYQMIPPATPTPYPGAWPQITCTATRVEVDVERVIKRLQRDATLAARN